MLDEKGNNTCVIGMVGLGVMGRNLLLNMADHGFTVAGYDNDKNKVDSLRAEAKDKPVYATSTIDEFLNLLKKPRAIMMLVPAGHAVDSVIQDFLPHLESEDLLIDAGNSHFTDTNTRLEFLGKKGIHFLGIGISGGEEGARRGPSIMPGGVKDAYERIRPVLEAVAAKAGNKPCVTWLGYGSAGHYVKMVHNGIEYAIMQLIAESYDLLKRGQGVSNETLAQLFHDWNASELNSYLVEITSHIFAKKDDKTDGDLIDKIACVARQKGTGMWTSESGMELQIPVSVIDVAVNMRDLSVFSEERAQAEVLYPRVIEKISSELTVFANQIKSALYCGMLVAYAQGFALLKVASEKYAYDIDLEAVAATWRAGCIIRAALLENIRDAFHANPDIENILLDKNLAKKIMEHQENLRKVIGEACHSGIPASGMMATLAYLDAFRSAWLPANLIQAQRDYFGAHTYARIDLDGIFHTNWEK